MKKRALPVLFLLLLSVFSCKDKVASSNEVYNNNFESGNLNNISGGAIEIYNGGNVLGRYNNGGFTLTLDNLPKHDLISVSFILNIHDTWDGNSAPIDGPDIWEMFIDDDPYISTTFSNYPCAPGEFCKPQSYPHNFPNNFNNPKTGSIASGLPPAGCSSWYGTTVYQITKTFAHKGNTIAIKCLDKLIQTNASDAKCDESWSIDNLNVKAIKL